MKNVKLKGNLNSTNLLKLFIICLKLSAHHVNRHFLHHFAGKQPASLRCLASVLITALCSLNKRCLAMENTAKGKKQNVG